MGKRAFEWALVDECDSGRSCLGEQQEKEEAI